VQNKDRIESIPIHLGPYLKGQKLKNVEIHILTGIPRTRLTTLTKPNNSSLSAEELFLIALATLSDLDKMAEYIFKDFYIKEKSKVPVSEHNTKFDQYLFDVLNTQKDLANMTGISETRISLLRNDVKSVLQASELFLIAKSLNRKVSDAFKLTCGHLKLKSVEQQAYLKGIYDTHLQDGKDKRQNKK
jgi:DNA-binding Xre family transcriptional regulator